MPLHLCCAPTARLCPAPPDLWIRSAPSTLAPARPRDDRGAAGDGAQVLTLPRNRAQHLREPFSNLAALLERVPFGGRAPLSAPAGACARPRPPPRSPPATPSLSEALGSAAVEELDPQPRDSPWAS